MKKSSFFIGLLLALSACTRETVDPPEMPIQDKYFSRVYRYTDNRTPQVDTIWTLQLFNQQMVDSFARYNNYVYSRTSTYIEVGVLWSR